jgi:hypothetical protein
MKARLVPVYFKSGRDKEFDEQVNRLKRLLAGEAEILEPRALGSPLPGADAVIFPQLLGDAYKQIDDLKRIKIPLLSITSEFGTVAMWDWEIVSFLKSEGLKTFAPYNLDLTKKVCRSLGLRREMKETRFLVFQDNPGKGMQADIFKRFYWWEERCTHLIKEKFGVVIEKRSFKKLGEEARAITDQEAEAGLKARKLKTEGLSQSALNSAMKLTIAVAREIEKDGRIKGVGINCLNESFFSDTTPCLAWDILFEEKGVVWACEADTVSLLTQYIIHKSLDVPIMMSNIYPFLMGQAALKHERIDDFPPVDEPDNHLLVAHCGYLGVLPRSFSTEWTLRPKVLAIVDENAHAMDARLPIGDITLAKLDPTLSRILVLEGTLESYAQYPDSDCRNGAVIRVPKGHQWINALYSHHNILVVGHRSAEIGMLAQVFDLAIEGV